ncbi:MAG: sugar ABC transporter permease [Caldilineaceae bacterium]
MARSVAKSTDSAQVLGKPKRQPRMRIDLFPYLLVAPAILLVAMMTLYPAIFAIRLSLMDINLLSFTRGAEFIGLQNYTAAFQDAIFLDGLWRTVRWVVFVAGSQMLVALPIALFLNTPFIGRAFVRAAVLIPYVVPAAVVAIIWRFMVDANFGVINDILYRIGLIDSYQAWMGQPNASFLIIAFAMIWTGFPFYAISLLAALQSITDDLYEAARIDGAGAWQQFRYITMPLILPTILLLLLLRTIWLSHNVDLIFLMSEGGPGYNNYTVAIYSFILTWSRLEIGYPAAMAIVLAIVLLLASAVYVNFIERSREAM